jgi:hypothetical protein
MARAGRYIGFNAINLPARAIKPNNPYWVLCGPFLLNDFSSTVN